VRAALALVGRGEAPLGIVYETDAKIEPNAKIIGHFPDGSYPAIVYPVALTANAKPGAQKYLDALHSAASKAVFQKYGFTVLTK
jgi:molybdate transport system substrate-binding protein